MTSLEPFEITEALLREADHRGSRAQQQVFNLLNDLGTCPRVLDGLVRMTEDWPNGRWLYSVMDVIDECGRDSRNRWLRRFAVAGPAAWRPPW